MNNKEKTNYLIKEKIIKEVHKNEINPGDTIHYNNTSKTVCKKNITYNNWYGRSIFNDNFKLGYEKVLKINDIRKYIKFFIEQGESY